MTLFTDNPFEKMMIQKPNVRREKSPPVPYPPLRVLPLQETVPLCGVLYQENKK